MPRLPPSPAYPPPTGWESSRSAGVYDFALGGNHCLRILYPHKQKTLDDEARLMRDALLDGSLLSGVPSVWHVVNATVQRVHELDLKWLSGEKQDFRWRDHWENYQGHEKKVLAGAYASHAMITVNDNAMVDDVAAYMNRLFDSDRAKYPLHMGWNAMGVHYRSTIPLDIDHPFYRHVRTGKLGPDCCRFLVANRMAAEGLDNKYLNVWGIAENLASVADVEQHLGRTLRSAAYRVGDELRIQPASHDTVYLITHSTFGVRQGGRLRKSNAEIIRRAIYYLLHMEESTADMMTLDEYIAVEHGGTDQGRLRPCKSISLADKCDLVEAVAGCLSSGRPERLNALLMRDTVAHDDRILCQGAASDNPEHGPQMAAMELRSAYVESLLINAPVAYSASNRGGQETRTIDAVADVRNAMLSDAPPDADIILEEEELFVPKFTIATASAWLNDRPWGDAVLPGRHVLGDQQWLERIERMRGDWDASYNTLALEFDETPADRVRLMADQIVSRHRIPSKRELILRIVLEGVQYRLGQVSVAGLFDLEFGGALCKSCVTYSLRSERFQDQLFKWVTLRLLQEGELPYLKTVLRGNIHGRQQ